MASATTIGTFDASQTFQAEAQNRRMISKYLACSVRDFKMRIAVDLRCTVQWNGNAAHIAR
jgi:hypothetical protein